MKLAFFISGLGTGGAERVMSILANEMNRRGHEVFLVHQGPASSIPAYPLDPGVRVVPTGLSRTSRSFLEGLKANLKRLRTLRATFRELRPDLLVSFMDRTNVLAVLATRGQGLPVVVSERMDPRGNPLPLVWRWLRLLAYTLCDGLVMQSPGARDFFPAWIRRKAVVLPNPILQPGDRARLEEGGRVAVAMGRLDRSKGYDLLLPAFKAALEAQPGWTLRILGEGPERPELEAQAGRLGLGARIQLPGRIQDPHPELARADLFILSSRVEGFPNALCEAMACGLPVIAAECTDSIREILQDGAAGRIVPPEDPAALTAALAALMADPAARRTMGERARRAIARYQGPGVIEAWERTLAGALRKA